MSKEHKILLITWVSLSFLLVWLVPGDKIREASLIFLFKQLLTWLFGVVVAELGLIQYPVRLFKKAIKTSFDFEFFAYPAICVFFNLFYPFGDSIIVQIAHYALYTTGITVFEVLLERYTNLINYIKWKWYWTWITVFITFMASNFFYRWFFQL